MKNLPLFISLLFVLTCAKEDSQDPGTTPSNITPKYILTATAGEGGSVAPSSGSFNAGTQVSITATPSSGYTFSGWSNGSSDNPVTVTLDSNTSITANFALIPVYTITVSSEDGGSVSSEGGDYQEGTQVTLTATPDEGYEFSGWSDGNTEATRVITASEDLTLTATFTELEYSYQLTVTSTEGGSISSEGGEYNEGTEVTITATPDEGYRFLGWSDGNTEESITITLSEDTSIEAVFELIPVYTVTVTSTEGGSVSTEGGEYEEGSEVTITATPDEGYRFIGWSNSSTEESITITLSEDTTLEALFEIIKYTVNINNTVGGTTEGFGEYEYGSIVTLSASPFDSENVCCSDFIFLGWSGDINSNDNIIEFEITSNINVTANFKDTVNFKSINIEGEGEFIIDNYIYETNPNGNIHVIGFDISIKEEYYDTFRGWTNISVPTRGLKSISTNKEKKISINTKDRFDLNGELIGYRIGIVFQDFPGEIKTHYEVIPENFNGIPSYKFRKGWNGAQGVGYFSNETGEYIFIAPGAGDDAVDKSETFYGSIFKKIDGYWKFYKVDTGVSGWGFRQIKIIDNKYIIIGDGNEVGDPDITPGSGPLYYGVIDGENISWTMAGPEEEWFYFHGSGGDDINGDGLIDVGGSGG